MKENKLIIIGNWKMNLNVSEASLLVHRLHQKIKVHRGVDVVLAPSMLALQPISLEIDRRQFKLAAQDAYYKDNGAFTGEVSCTMIRDLVNYVIIGHSERRIYFHETPELVRDKVTAAIRNEISPIICIGETKLERQSKETNMVIHDQLTSALANITSEDIEDVIIAYEPVWAISTFDGEIAKPKDIANVIKYIRQQVEHLYGAQIAKKVRVIYGGSVDDQTIGSYLEIDGCDGALVGGASLNYYKFSEIIDKASKIALKNSEK